jgi:N-acetylmuramoyl-L-alanine amidase
MVLSCTQSEISSNTFKPENTILIDISHGGEDPGAISKQGIKEKDLSLNYASYINAELTRKKLGVIQTRTEDEFISLADRVEMAESKNIDVVVSIHFNTSKDPSESGIKTYFKPECEKSKSLDNLFHANVIASNLIKDNGGDPGVFFVLKNSPVPAILIDVGYLTNEEDLKLIKNDEFKVKFASVLSETLVEYLRIY